MTLRVRKFSAVDREWPIFEVMKGEKIIFDVTRTDGGELEVAFHEGGAGEVLPLAEVLSAIEEAQRQLDSEGSG